MVSVYAAKYNERLLSNLIAWRIGGQLAPYKAQFDTYRLGSARPSRL